jgi:hypothetical protein
MAENIVTRNRHAWLVSCFAFERPATFRERRCRVSPVQIHALVTRIRSEFVEMPRLRLTLAQASRLWGLEEAACERVVDILIRADFLHWTPGGKLTRIES